MTHNITRQLQAQLPPVPTSTSVTGADFWLCLWLRHLAVADAASAHMEDAQVWDSASPALKYALCDACGKLQGQANDDMDKLIEAGGLLYAFEGTTRPAHAIAAAKGGAL